MRKREKPITITSDNKPVWVGLSQTKDNIPVNAWFAENPQMVLGKMTYGGRLYANERETACEPFPNADLGEQLKKALSNISARITDYKRNDKQGENTIDLSVPADPNVRNHSFALVIPSGASGGLSVLTPGLSEGGGSAPNLAGAAVYFRENSRMYPAKLKGDALNRCKAMIQIRDAVRELVNLQREDKYGRLENKINQAQKRLNDLYDDFVEKYGFLKDDKNKKAFAGDSSYYLL